MSFNPRPKSGLGSSAFARHYLRNRFFFLFLQLLRCFSSLGCSRHNYIFIMRYQRITTSGFPHSDISGSKITYISPKHFVVCHVLLHLLMPRHPPYALSYLITLYPNLMRFLLFEIFFLSYFFSSKNKTTLSSFQRTFERIFILSKLSKTFFSTFFRSFFLSPQKGGDPSPRSRRDTLLRLHPNHLSYLKWPPPLLVRLPHSGITDFRGVTGGVYNTRERIHPDILIQDYQRFQLHEVELQTSIRTETDFGVLLLLTGLLLFISAIIARLQPQT